METLEMKQSGEKVGTKKKRKKRWLALRIAALLLFALLLFSALTPIPVVYAVRTAFTVNIAMAPDGYEDMEAAVSATKDVVYPSAFRQNLADIYIPKKTVGPFPVVLWVHGGAFVGGRKRDIEIYATALAARGFAVVCINYERAPEAKYPTPVMQTGEAYLWLTEVAEEYHLDMSRFALAGDSAGAHIVAQFAAIQSNGAYAQEMGIASVVAPDTLRAVVLFCGPYDVEKIAENEYAMFRFLMGQAAWAYFGSRNWAEQVGEQATITNHITAAFPPTFLTDGNTASFEEHSRLLEQVLQLQQVPVESFYIPDEEAITIHEYQFLMDTPAGAVSYERVVAFLEQYLV